MGTLGLRAGQLARMTATQTGHMMDSCQIMAYSTNLDAYNVPDPTYTAGAEIVCGYGFDKESGPEVQDTSEVPLHETAFRLPKETAVTSLDRVRLTKRFGVAVGPFDYEIVGTPELGPSGLVVKVKLVTDGT